MSWSEYVTIRITYDGIPGRSCGLKEFLKTRNSGREASGIGEQDVNCEEGKERKGGQKLIRQGKARQGKARQDQVS
jgi:hypothetical protein